MSTDPAKLALYAMDGLTPGTPFPGNTIPANLIDQNAVLELGANTFPHPNFGTGQYISAIPQPTNVREDVVRIDHTINSKFQLMGHYLHDAVTQTSVSYTHLDVYKRQGYRLTVRRPWGNRWLRWFSEWKAYCLQRCV